MRAAHEVALVLVVGVARFLALLLLADQLIPGPGSSAAVLLVIFAHSIALDIALLLIVRGRHSLRQAGARVPPHTPP